MAIFGILGLYVATRKRYTIPDFRITIPNVQAFSGRKESDKFQIVKKIINSINITLTSHPNIGWLFDFDPVFGVEIPVKVWLPWDFPVVYPQIKNQIGKNIKIEKKMIGNTLLGYIVNVKNVSFYA